jgi:hypothetical protein
MSTVWRSGREQPRMGGNVAGPRRRVFQPDEYRLLAALVAAETCTTWLEIVSRMPGRTARQCRDRWTNYLAPTISLNPWTAEEDALIAENVEEVGTKWATISKLFPGRSDNAIKNRWYTQLKRRAAAGAAKQQAAPQRIAADGSDREFEDVIWLGGDEGGDAPEDQRFAGSF